MQEVIHVYQEKAYEITVSVQLTEEFRQLTEEQRKVLRAKPSECLGQKLHNVPYADVDLSCRHKPPLKRKRTKHRENGHGTSARRRPMETVETLDLE